MNTLHCPSCDGYQTAVMDDGQRSVGVCEGVEARTVETAEEWKERVWAAWKEYRDKPGELSTYWQAFRAGFTVASPEPVPLAPEYADPEEVRRLSTEIIAREKPLLDRLAEHDGPEDTTPARECGNDSRHGYGTGYCGDCEEEGGHGD